MRIGSLFSGAGGLDMAVEQVFGGTVAWHCELSTLVDDKGKSRANAAPKVLAHHWPGVPNLDDISRVDFRTVEPVDVLCGGFPCQDISVAGRRAGMGAGTRSGLWSEFARAIDELRPQFVVIENVRNLLNVEANRHVEPGTDVVGDGDVKPVLRALGAVLGDLSDLGFDAQWTTVSAASVGAPHQRERVFILAHPTGQPGIVNDGDQLRAWGRTDGHRPGAAIRPSLDSITDLLPTPTARDFKGGNTTVLDDHGRRRPVTLEDTTRSRGDGGASDLATVACLLPTPSVADGMGGHLTRSGTRSDELLLPGVARAYGLGELLPTPNASDGSGGGQHPDKWDGHSRQLIDYALLHGTERWGKYEAAIRRWESLTRPAPSPTEPNTKGNPRLSAAFPEWMMGWPAGWVTAVPGISRNDQLRIIGNGVCPQQAVAAVSWLLRSLEVAA